MSPRIVLLAGAAAAALATAQPIHAAPLQVGSGNEAVIEPNVPHPNETPCTVPLVTDAQFTNFNNANYSFTPPAACPGPWAKVILKMKLSLNEGVQYDRTGLLFMNGVPLWFGTTAEPRATLAPHWKFERDVTDYTALFETAQTGYLSIGNIVNSTYTGIITASATLEFYPPTSTDPAPVTADVVLPLPGSGGAGILNNGTDTLATTMVFPTNILQAKLDLFLQGQSGDEFWYTCVPNSLTGVLFSCGNGALREGEVSVDSMAAGVAPVYPWIFTGGIDPFLWQPIPGVQTFNFVPFQVDLSPFAGLLSNGLSHTISASVYGDNGYFQATGAIRLFLDHGTSAVTGGIVSDTLQAVPNVTTTPNITTVNGITTGTVDTRDKRNFKIKGTVTGSAGTTVNEVDQTTSFKNKQRFDITATKYTQNISQQTDITVTSTSTTNGVATTTTSSLQWPLSVDITEYINNSGGGRETTTVNQQYIAADNTEQAGLPLSDFNLSNAINSTDTLFFDNQGYITGNNNQSESAAYQRTGTGYKCFKRNLAAESNVLSEVQTGC
jgi:hypothetical protein